MIIVVMPYLYIGFAISQQCYGVVDCHATFKCNDLGSSLCRQDTLTEVASEKCIILF